MKTSKRQKAVIRLLSDGGKYSALQISAILGVGDARSIIRDIRNMGVTISDVWKRNRDNTGRFKLYFINTKRL